MEGVVMGRQSLTTAALITTLLFSLLLSNRPALSAEWEPQNSPSEGSSLHGIWGSSGTDVFAVGGSCAYPPGCPSAILHYDGSTWTLMDSGTTTYLFDVWGSSSTDVFAVGFDGAILHYDGSTWTLMDSGTTTYLFDVWGSSSTDVFAVGNGIILHYDGSTWASMDTETTTGPSSVSLEPVSETISSPMGIVTTAYLHGIWGSSGTDVFAVGDSCGFPPLCSNSTILHYDGSTWSPMSNGGTEALFGVWGSSSTDVFAVGFDGAILHYDGTAWSAMTSGTTRELWGVWGTSRTDVFAVGDYGTILHYDGDFDDDGIIDNEDNCSEVFNPDQVDYDSDGLGDACDNCPDHPNPDQADRDSDGVGDECDICPLDPLNDDDGDTVCGDEDNCPEVSNPGQEDTDGDQVGNVCDNCPDVYNPDQLDSDDDGIGDECDVDFLRAMIQTYEEHLAACEDELAQCCPETKCGDGIIQWKAGETCEPPDSMINPRWYCDTECHVQQVICGDGVKQGWEQCEVNEDCPNYPCQKCEECHCVPNYPGSCGDGCVQWKRGEQCEIGVGNECGPTAECSDCVCVAG
jgi:hypothetical protein